LAQPLIDTGREAVTECCDEFLLVVHDWSNLHYKAHSSKRDLTNLSCAFAKGYVLQSALLVSDRSGHPLAPVFQALQSADGVYSSRAWEVQPPSSQLDSLEPVMDFVEHQRFTRPAVHIVDAEADSVAHYRQWTESPSRLFLVRADTARLVEHAGEERSVAGVQQELHAQQAFRYARKVEYHGKPAEQWLAETSVVLRRAARPQRKGEPRRTIAGPPVTLRLIVSEVRDAAGNLLATWYLLTNVPQSVAGERIALWYYWRWRIESYFKLLKTAGQQIEHWQQDHALAIAKRLLVASMACVIVWRIARSQEPDVQKLAKFLVRLSGRQTKRARPITDSALLAGMWTFLTMLEALATYDAGEIEQFAKLARHYARPGPTSEGA
jgi:hypothetical protein